MGVMLFLIWILNFAISAFNAWSVGRSWAESKAVGGWPRFMVWCGAVMSACGFTWCYLVLLAVGGMAIGKLSAEMAQAVFSLGYLVIILPLLGSGLGIMVSSWAYFWRRRTLGGGMLAGWNTFAQIYNTYTAIRAVPAMLKNLGGFARSREGNRNALIWVVFLVVIALADGILTTMLIVRWSARSSACAVKEKYALEA